MIKKLFLLSLFPFMLYASNLELSSTVISDNEKILSSRYMGFVKAIYVVEGDLVKKGQLLYEIDAFELDKQLEQANYTLQMQNNHYETLLLNYQRYKRLYAKDLISKFELEQMSLRYHNAKNQLNIAQAKLQELKHQYQYLKVKAPNDGLILKKSIQQGEMAIPGKEALVLTDLTDLKIEAQLSQDDLQFVQVGQKVTIHIDALNHQEEAQIISIVPHHNSLTHSFVLKIKLKSIKNLYPGMYAKVIIKRKE